MKYNLSIFYGFTMFYDEKPERQILHNSFSKVPYDNSKIIKHQPVELLPMKPEPRKIGGFKSQDNGVSTLKPSKLLYSSSMSGGAKPKRPPTEWQKLLKKIREEKGSSLKDAIKFVKDNNLYQK